MSYQTKNLREDIQGLTDTDVIQQDLQAVNRHVHCLVALIGQAQYIKSFLDDGLVENLGRVLRVATENILSHQQQYHLEKAVKSVLALG